MTAMVAKIIIVVTHTPIWVWPLYALLLFLGFQRTRDSILPVWRVLILPLIVGLLAILSVVSLGLDAVPAFLLGLAVGGTLGWQLERPDATRRLPNGRLWLRGEWLSFGQLVLVLVFRYATSVTSAMDPMLNATPAWHLGTAFASAALSALFLGRTAARLRVLVSSAPKPA